MISGFRLVVKGSKVVKWVKIFGTEEALEIQQARPTEECGNV